MFPTLPPSPRSSQTTSFSIPDPQEEAQELQTQILGAQTQIATCIHVLRTNFGHLDNRTFHFTQESTNREHVNHILPILPYLQTPVQMLNNLKTLHAIGHDIPRSVCNSWSQKLLSHALQQLQNAQNMQNFNTALVIYFEALTLLKNINPEEKAHQFFAIIDLIPQNARIPYLSSQIFASEDYHQLSLHLQTRKQILTAIAILHVLQPRNEIPSAVCNSWSQKLFPQKEPINEDECQIYQSCLSRLPNIDLEQLEQQFMTLQHMASRLPQPSSSVKMILLTLTFMKQFKINPDHPLKQRFYQRNISFQSK